MKIVFTGSGTGGHFYPNIAVAEAIHDLVREQRILSPRLYYIAPMPYDEQALFDNDIIFLKVTAGKIRRYFSLENVSDFFKTLTGFFHALWTLFNLYPDAVFSKGGYASVPTVLAARVLGIPVIVHESDARPGRANKLGAKSAYRIAISFPSTAGFFPKKVQSKIALTGIPIRKRLQATHQNAATFPGLDASVPTVLILGGSSGSRRINDLILDALPDYVSFANIIHQTGKDEFKEVEATAPVILEGNPHKERYHPFPYLSAESLGQAAASATVVISRAGATAIAEIALWGKPSILIPIPESISHDQRTNAYEYAHTGAAEVLEEANMSSHVLASEARRISTDPAVANTMGAKSAAFGNPEAARLIAQELLNIGRTHEPDTEHHG
ncbi:UDP-N-acetylglucosamine--N-acetylmuramyl-(pentapeptide) pyrophosphoryl-undecaprenol N-acetylglucosamine transferase [Patescibacteria group bacterium]|nr:UDP-N-acetylglucosamine--N-acetylmuramyl-(pentapeptide) pyrophosphoryl-undecaprenol N-acetylglucosamine transferase [Patescibacteria group bacterium]MBU1755098.1 UDP-N-acetylglucosamine--N-acetylmuramyl-(pentapeptide) pyrophosphoryl-undecaprenol N-acetylglucosamine transferase [Patescibacteria group bacterium]